jgi:hypothetical protein
LGIEVGTGKSFLDSIGVHPENFSNIVILSLNNYLGDNLIFHFSLIPFLRNQYPNSELTLISPKAEIIFPSVRYQFQKYTFPVRFTEYQNRKDRDEHIALLRDRLPHFIKAHVKPGSLVLFDLTTLIKASSEIDSLARNPESTPLPAVYRALTEIGAVGIGVSNLENGYIMSGLAQLDVVGIPTPQEVLSSPWLTQIKGSHGQSIGFSIRQKVKPNIFGNKNENIYQSWLANMSFLFGDQLELSWNEKIYNGLDEGRTREYLATQSSFPDRPFVLINLNTFGRSKVDELRPWYLFILKQISTEIARLHPAWNIVYTFPENQFGPEVQEDVINWKAQSPLPLIAIPSSRREHLPTLIRDSRFVISYDTGLAHLAAFKNPRHVLTISATSGGAHTWTRPGQDFLQLHAPQTPNELIAPIVHWIQKQ